jgi:hypothetical protein
MGNLPADFCSLFQKEILFLEFWELFYKEGLKIK